MSAEICARALFLDRDGVLNEEVGYLYRPEDVRWMEGAFSLCRTAMELGYKLIVVTNQSGIARGMYTEADFHSLMEWMRAEFEREQVRGGWCVLLPVSSGAWCGRVQARTRGPQAGTGYAAARSAGAWTGPEAVGDGGRPLLGCGGRESAGLRKAFLLRGTEAVPCPGEYTAIGSLAEVEWWIREIR